MHEEALLRDLLRKIDEVARRHGARRVTGVSVWIGALSHLSPSWLRGRWELATAGSIAAGARLTVRLSTDAADPRAAGVVLESVETDEEDPSREGGPPSQGRPVSRGS